MVFWSLIESEETLRKLLDSSKEQPVFILKHSNRCALSAMAKNRIEKSPDERLTYALIDVVKNRGASDILAELFSVQHESPQAFLILNSELVEVKSHLAINSQGFSILLDSLKDESAKSSF